MMFLVNAFQTIERKMGIHLSGRDIGVPQDGLYRSKIGAIFDHVRRAAVP